MTANLKNVETINIERAAISVAEFCAMYGIGKSFFYEELKAGRIRAKKAGARTLIPTSEARAWWAQKETL